MTKRLFLIFFIAFIALMLLAGLIYFDTKKSTKQLESNIERLSTDAKMFRDLKYLDNDKRTLEKTIKEIQKFAPSLSTTWSSDGVLLEQKNISQNLVDKIVFTFLQKGHLIVYQKIIKQKEGFDIAIKVAL